MIYLSYACWICGAFLYWNGLFWQDEGAFRDAAAWLLLSGLAFGLAKLGVVQYTLRLVW